ncbi:MAG: rhomboid family intramembrane serine protease [Paramuribaculum sp.]|nr:rhomboid family intramembrane serine protease [Paramuribaculum sp.]
MRDINEALSFLKKQSALTWLIAANVLIFIALRITAVIFHLCGNSGFEEILLQYLELPSSPLLLLLRPWTPVTYMFCQFDAWHLVFNMLVLYWIGKILAMAVGPKRLAWIYLLGGLTGAIIFTGVSAIAPGIGYGDYLTGSSASVFAVMTATAVIMPKIRVNLVLIGEIQLRWVVITLIIIDLCLGAGGENVGGHIAHLGGVIAGALYPLLHKRLSHKRKPMSINPVSSSADDMRNLDEILDKIKQSGYASLTANERKQLFEISSRIK